MSGRRGYEARRRSRQRSHMKRKQCGSGDYYKRRFDSSYEATLAAQKTQRDVGIGTFESYGCQFCGFWHVGRIDNTLRILDRRRERLAGR